MHLTLIHSKFGCVYIFSVQKLKEKQKELEEKADVFKRLNGGLNEAKDDKKAAGSVPLFRTDPNLLHRKQSTAANPKKQQAVVTPLQGKT